MKPPDQTAILDAKLRTLFPDLAQFEEASRTLNEYGIESHEREPERVRLAILKISEGTLDSIRKHTMAAQQDYRDTLWAAEYPHYNGTVEDPEKRAEVDRRNQEQYEKWLELP